MLVQSNGGKVYAVLANNADYELGVLPQLTFQSTTCFLALRCRYKALTQTILNPMLIPKEVLVGGIERSGNTLRGVVMLNTGITVSKVGPNFGTWCAERLVKAAAGFLMPEDPDGFLSPKDLRTDFVGDFAQLLSSQVESIYPPKDFSQLPHLITAFDLEVYKDNLAADPKAAFSVVATNESATTGNVEKVKFGKDVDSEPASEEAGEVDPEPTPSG